MAFRLLLLGDGNGIDFVLDLDDAGTEYGSLQTGSPITRAFFMAAVLIFCILLLNLFIAVISQAYSKAFRDGVNLHHQERASICLNCMLLPHWPLRVHWRSLTLSCCGCQHRASKLLGCSSSGRCSR